MPQNKNVAAEILSFDFELFIGVRFDFIPYNYHKIMFCKCLYPETVNPAVTFLPGSQTIRNELTRL